MNHVVSKLILLSLVGVAACATPKVNQNPQQAENPIYFNRIIPYQNVSSIKPEIVQECEIAENLLVGIDERSAANGLPLTDKASSRTLSVKILHATPGTIRFGNFLSEPATLGIEFKVTEGEEVIIIESKSCSTNLAGFMGLQPSACNKLEKCGRSNGEYISERISRRLYQ